MAGLSEVPVLIIEADDRKAMELAMIENLQREDLNPIEEAEGYKALMEDYGLTQEEAAERVGKSRSNVANVLRLLNLSAPVRALLAKGVLSAGRPGAASPESCGPGKSRQSGSRGRPQRAPDRSAGKKTAQ